MNFNDHSDLNGKHALLSPSNYHWINYDDHKLSARFVAAQRAKRGSDLHEFAHMAIRLGVRLPDTDDALHMYVNDGIGFKMNVEQPLFYSPNCFGHADTICFRQMFLRIHDLKTGLSPTSEHQLEVYAALFCLEYGANPPDIEIELRIYQGQEIRIFQPSSELIQTIMDRIVDFDIKLEQMKEVDVW